MVTPKRGTRGHSSQRTSPTRIRWTSREKLMRKTTISLLATTALICLVSAGPSSAQSALTGTVASSEEGPMEGVLVTARKDGSTIAITVATDAQGRYSFPAAKLDPGHYTLRTPACGNHRAGKRSADIAAGSAATADLKLKRTRNISAQLTNAEWLETAAGTPGPTKALFTRGRC